LVIDKKGEMLAEAENILNRWKWYFCQSLYCMCRLTYTVDPLAWYLRRLDGC